MLSFCRGEHCSSVCLACRRTSVILRFSIKKTEESRKRQHSRLRLMFAPNFFVGECYLCPRKSLAYSYRLGRVLRPRRSTRLAFIGSLGMTLVRCVDNSRIASPCLPRRGRGTTKWWKESPPHCGSGITDAQCAPLRVRAFKAYSRSFPVTVKKLLFDNYGIVMLSFRPLKAAGSTVSFPCEKIWHGQFAAGERP